MDLTTLTDEDLDALRVDVLNEQDRRRIITEAPAQIETLSASYYRAAQLEAPPVEEAQHGIDAAKAAADKRP